MDVEYELTLEDGTPVKINRGAGKIACGGRTIETPEISNTFVFPHSVLLTVYTDRDRSLNSQLGDLRREENLVRVTPSDGVDWIVDVPDDYRDRVGKYNHGRKYLASTNTHTVPPKGRWTGDRLVTAAVTRNDRESEFVEIDIETGEFLDWWPKTQFKIGGTYHEFDSKVKHALYVDGVTVIGTWADPASRLYAFDSSGDQLWETSWKHRATYEHVDGSTVSFKESDRVPILEVDVHEGP